MALDYIITRSDIFPDHKQIYINSEVSQSVTSTSFVNPQFPVIQLSQLFLNAIYYEIIMGSLKSALQLQQSQYRLIKKGTISVILIKLTVNRLLAVKVKFFQDFNLDSECKNCTKQVELSAIATSHSQEHTTPTLHALDKSQVQSTS